MPPDASFPALQQSQASLPSFEMLYERYHEQIYRYLYAHLKHEHDAADLMQQVFLQAWRQKETYEARRGTVATWLFSIAHHRLVDFYRVSRTSVSWEAIPEMSTTDEDPEAKVISEETIAQVRKMLEALSQAEQELLALRFAAQLSSAEIAPLIGKSEAATKKQLTQLLHRLQEQYRHWEELIPLPELLEPALPEFVAALLRSYAVPLPDGHAQTIRQNLLEAQSQ